MPRPILALLLGVGPLLGQTVSNPPALPQWLVPYAGASAVTAASSTLVESSYTTAANPPEVSGHYRKLFAANGISFAPNFDGLGTSIRGSAPECDLLIQIREASSGTRVRVTCTLPQASANPPVGGGSEIVVTSGRGSQPSYSGRGPASASASGYHLKSAEEIRQYNEQRAREIVAKREAFARESTAIMQQYDKPVYPAAPLATKTLPLPLADAPRAYYHDDAPPLVWPTWLGTVNGERLSEASKFVRGPESSLSRKYLTAIAMTKIRSFYQSLLEANGFVVRKSRISTGNTSAGVQQNASGEVEAYRKEGSGVNPPTTTVAVSFRRMYLNEPITVWIKLSVEGSFGR